MPCPKCNGFMGPMSDICHDCGHADGEPGMSRWLLLMAVMAAVVAIASALLPVERPSAARVADVGGAGPT